MKFNLFLFFLTFVLVIATASAAPTGTNDGGDLDKRITSCGIDELACKASCGFPFHDGICCPCSNIPGREVCTCEGKCGDPIIC
jgi:hypothetical protein